MFLNSYKEDGLRRHVLALVEATLSCDVIGLPVNGFVFREYIPMVSMYTAFFSKMPVNPERRYFVENGKVLCHHPYWIKESIIKPSKKNWSQLSDIMNHETTGEISTLLKYASLVSCNLDGFWSVDFCLALDGRWILIDMALGENSWHPKDCPKNRTVEIDYLQLAVDKFKRLKDAKV